MKKDKIIKGGFYLTVVNVLSQVLAIVVNIVLARLLLPSDFGLVALTATFIGFITLFTNIGFGASVIHEQDATHKQLSSIYWLNFLLGVATFIVIIFTAQLAANFYEDQRLVNIIKIAALNILITPFFAIHSKIFERDLEFKLLSKINLTAIVIGSAAAITGAYYGLGVYALLLQPIVASIVRLILVLINSKWHPSFAFNFKEVKAMVWYSVKYKASSMTLYFERNVDYLILGKFFNSSILGYYAFAYNIMYTPVKRISYIFSNVLFPSFSSIKDDKQKIISGYFKSVQLVAMVSFPIMTLIAFNAEIIIQTIFGSKWNEAIPIVQILSFAGAIQSISQFGGVIFSSIGKPEINLYVSVGRTLLTVLAIVIGVQYSILGVAYLLVVAKALSFILLLIVLNRHIPFSVLQLLKNLKGPLVSVALLGLLFVLFKWTTLEVSSIVQLIIMIIAAGLVTLTFHRPIIREILTVLRTKSIA